jgi:hypothetical protein
MWCELLYESEIHFGLNKKVFWMKSELLSEFLAKTGLSWFLLKKGTYTVETAPPEDLPASPSYLPRWLIQSSRQIFGNPFPQAHSRKRKKIEREPSPAHRQIYCPNQIPFPSAAVHP